MSEIIERLRAADEEYRHLRKTLRARLEKQLKEELERAGGKRDVLAYMARQQGEKVIDIAKLGMDTSDRKTAYDAIDRGRQLSPDAPVVVTGEDGVTVEVAPEFTLIDENTVRVRPADATVDKLIPLLGHTDPSLALREADFRLSAPGRLEAITPGYDAATGRNAVVALVLGENAEYRGRVLDWLRTKGIAA